MIIYKNERNSLEGMTSVTYSPHKIMRSRDN